MFHATNLRAALRVFTFALLTLSPSWAAAQTGDPIKIGFSMALTGGVAPNGKQLLAALELWRDDVNQKGGCSAGRSSSSTTTTRATQRTCRASTPS